MIDRSKWHWFRVGDLFPLQKCKCSNATELLEDGDEIAYIGAKKSDNGVMRYVKREEKLVSQGNCIVFIGDGQGSVGYCLYQPVEFIGSTTLIVGYNEHLNPYNAAFLVSILDQERFRYSFGRKYKKEVIANTQIQLPAIKLDNEEYGPDWQYMETFVKDRIIPQLPQKAQKVWLQKYNTEPQKHEKIKLNTNVWGWFELKDIFSKTRGERLTIPDRIDGEIPFVTAGEADTGVATFISNEVKTYHNAITIDMFGYSCYREYEFACDDNILVLQNSNVNRYNGLFIASIINIDRYRCAYGRQYRQKTFDKHKIKLPVTPSGDPDWQFMEDYIKSLPYSKNLEPEKEGEQVQVLQKRLKSLEQELQAQKAINGAAVVNIIGGNVTYNDNSKTYNVEK